VLSGSCIRTDIEVEEPFGGCAYWSLYEGRAWWSLYRGRTCWSLYLLGLCACCHGASPRLQVPEENPGWKSQKGTQVGSPRENPGGKTREVWETSRISCPSEEKTRYKPELQDGPILSWQDGPHLSWQDVSNLSSKTVRTRAKAHPKLLAGNAALDFAGCQHHGKFSSHDQRSTTEADPGKPTSLKVARQEPPDVAIETPLGWRTWNGGCCAAGSTERIVDHHG
jgi:hypothetical protein